MLHRRELLGTAIAASGSKLLHSSESNADDQSAAVPIIDTNVNLFQWPFRRLPLDDTSKLVEKLQSLGVQQAWASSFEAVLHRDIASVNSRLVEACRHNKMLVPIAAINPALPGWERDFRVCVDTFDMPGIRLLPNYHGYSLTDPSCLRLIGLAAKANRFVQVAAAMEDVRTQHRLVRVADVDLASIAEVITRSPDARIQILNLNPKGSLLKQLANIDSISFDTSRIDGTDGIAQLLKHLPHDRLLYGSHSPFLIPEAALIRVGENSLAKHEFTALLRGNAMKFRGS